MSTSEETPRRLTPTERLTAERERLHEVTMAAMLRPHAEPESAVTLSRNAAGNTQIEVTVRATDADAAFKQALALYDKAHERYPRRAP